MLWYYGPIDTEGRPRYLNSLFGTETTFHCLRIMSHKKCLGDPSISKLQC